MKELYFAEYLREFRAKGRITVEAPVIVRHGDGEDGEAESSLSSTMVDAVTMHGSEPSGQWRSSVVEPDRSFGLVFPLIKRPGNAFDYISVGRTENVDITLPLLQISKFHAYFNRGVSGEYTLADGGSKNGTRVGARRLEVRLPVAVHSGDRVSFGPYAFSFYLPPHFLELVAARAKVT